MEVRGGVLREILTRSSNHPLLENVMGSGLATTMIDDNGELTDTFFDTVGRMTNLQRIAFVQCIRSVDIGYDAMVKILGDLVAEYDRYKCMCDLSMVNLGG